MSEQVPSYQPEMPLDPAAEITSQQVQEANADDIMEAARLRIQKLDELSQRDDVLESEALSKKVEDQMRDMGQVSTVANQWIKHNTGATFQDFLDKRMAEEADPDRFDVYQKMSDWFEGQAQQGNASDLAEVLRGKQEAAPTPEAAEPAPAPAEKTPEEAQQEQEHQQRTVEDARSAVEKAHSAELLDDIVKLGKNRTRLSAKAQGGYGWRGDAPRSKQEESSLYLPGDLQQREIQRGNASDDRRKNFSETVMFSDIVEQETREVTRTRQEPGRFGKMRTVEYPATEPIPGKVNPKQMRNELTGQDEPVVRFRYNFNLNAYATKKASGSEIPDWRGYDDTRGGQIISVSVDLPKSVTDELKKQMQNERGEIDPTNARDLVEKLFLANNDGSISEKDWFKGTERGLPDQIRPPYEQLPKDWNVAIITGQETTSQSGNPTMLDHKIDRLPVAA
jgi:hypothetical protein